MKCHEINIPDGMDEATLHAILTGELGSRDRIPDRHFLAEASRLGRAMPVLEKEPAETGYQSIAAVPRLFRGHVDLARLTQQRRGELEAMGFGFCPSDHPVKPCLTRAQDGFSGAVTDWTSSYPLMVILVGSVAMGHADARTLDFTALVDPEAVQDVTGSGVVICAIDGGIDTDHASLTGRFTGIHTEHTDYEDVFGHGTAMAGLMVTDDYGLSPGATLELYRWSNDSGTGSTTNVNNCLAAVATQDALDSSTKRVVTMPLETTAGTNPFTAAVAAVLALGIPICAAAGNGSGGGDGAPLDTISHVWPAEMGFNAAITSGSTLTCTAFDHTFKISRFVNYGAPTNLLVPAINCRTTANDGATEITFGATSGASCLAAAALALLLETESKPADAAGVRALVRTLMAGCLHVDVDGLHIVGSHHNTAQVTIGGVTKTAVLAFYPS